MCIRDRDQDAVSMYLFSISVGESVFTDLYHSFPKGEKGKYQKIVNSLTRGGYESVLAYQSAFEAAAGDEAGTSELVGELSNEALIFICDQLDVETSAFIQKVKSQEG